jgi:hypothetical protein
VISASNAVRCNVIPSGSFLLCHSDTSFPRAMEGYKKALQTGTNPGGAPMTEQDKRFTSGLLEVMGGLVPQLQGIGYAGPNVTFTEQMNIDLGGRQVNILWPGNANTELPKPGGGDPLPLCHSERRRSSATRNDGKRGTPRMPAP